MTDTSIQKTTFNYPIPSWSELTEEYFTKARSQLASSEDKISEMYDGALTSEQQRELTLYKRLKKLINKATTKKVLQFWLKLNTDCL